MKLLLQAVQVFDYQSPYNGKKVDVLIVDGLVKEIAQNISVQQDYLVKTYPKAAISPAWLDMFMHIYEPGLEYREDFESALNAAAKAGYGSVCMLPNTQAPIDNNAQVNFVKNSAKAYLCEVAPIGAISQGIQGKDLAEMYDMHAAGAVAFSDGSKPVSNAGLMERALLYVKKFNGLVFSYPDQEELSHGAQMNEGVNSTILGMQAAPKLAEEIMVSRDLYLLEHTQSRLHFSTVSTKKSVQLIREAKQKGLQVTAGVAVHNLYFDDSKLLDFDSNFKVKPHLRNPEDIEALFEGLKDGTIDVIVSAHKPLHTDEKKVEFDQAYFGMSTLDAAFSAARTASKGRLAEAAMIEKFTNAYKILGLEASSVSEGTKANFTIFDLDDSFEFTDDRLNSKGKNCPFVGEQLEGRALGIVKGDKNNLL